MISFKKNLLALLAITFSLHSSLFASFPQEEEKKPNPQYFQRKASMKILSPDDSVKISETFTLEKALTLLQWNFDLQSKFTQKPKKETLDLRPKKEIYGYEIGTREERTMYLELLNDIAKSKKLDLEELYKNLHEKVEQNMQSLTRGPLPLKCFTFTCEAWNTYLSDLSVEKYKILLKLAFEETKDVFSEREMPPVIDTKFGYQNPKKEEEKEKFKE